MAYANYNPNPAGRSVGDCAVRAIARATGKTWEEAYILLVAEGLQARDLPNADSVWGRYLMRHGFSRHAIDADDQTVAAFAEAHPEGLYVLSMPGRHVVTVENGDYYDSWDSGAEIPVYYYSQD